MRAHDQSSIFSTGGKFSTDYGLLLELHALTLVARSYELLCWPIQYMYLWVGVFQELRLIFFFEAYKSLYGQFYYNRQYT